MILARYRPLFGVPGVRRALWLGLAIRTPMWAANVVLTLHIVTALHRSYGAAGVVTMAATVALGISGPWRGRLLDRVGLRRMLAPCLAVNLICWSAAPFLPFEALVPVVALAGLYGIPAFSITRQMMMAATPLDQRTAAHSLESVALEVSFMIGPALGVLLLTWWPTTWVLLGCQLGVCAGGIALWLADPALQHADEIDDPHLTPDATAPEGSHPGVPGRARPLWLTAPVPALLGISTATVLLLVGSDLSIVAALRAMGHPGAIGLLLTLWGAGSAIGGVIYGALHRRLPPAWLLAGLALTTLPAAAAGGPVWFGVLMVFAGLFCAPTLTATVDELSRVVPLAQRGEALGWQSGATTAGSALGAPVAGFAIDQAGWQGGLTLTAVVGLAVSLAAGSASAVARRRTR